MDLNSFYKLLVSIITQVKINERNLLFECLNNIAIKIELSIEKGKEEMLKQYFSILKSF